mgnify:CR=1 FL=1
MRSPVLRMVVELILLEFEMDCDLAEQDYRAIHKIKAVFTMMSYVDAAATESPAEPASLTDIVEAASAEVSLAQNAVSKAHTLMSLIASSASRRAAATRLAGERGKVWHCICGHENSNDKVLCDNQCGRSRERGRVSVPPQFALTLRDQSQRSGKSYKEMDDQELERHRADKKDRKKLDDAIRGEQSSGLRAIGWFCTDKYCMEKAAEPPR